MRFNLELTKPPTHPLRPINPGNARGFCITAPAGTELGSPYSYSTINNFFLHKRSLHPEGLHPSRNVAPSDFRPLRKILDCSLPYECEPCRSLTLGGRALTPPTRHSLGGLLPRQQADRPRTIHKATCVFTLAGLWEITPSFDELCPTLRYVSTCY